MAGISRDNNINNHRYVVWRASRAESTMKLEKLEYWWKLFVIREHILLAWDEATILRWLEPFQTFSAAILRLHLLTCWLNKILSLSWLKFHCGYLKVNSKRALTFAYSRVVTFLHTWNQRWNFHGGSEFHEMVFQVAAKYQYSQPWGIIWLFSCIMCLLVQTSYVCLSAMGMVAVLFCEQLFSFKCSYVGNCQRNGSGYG